MPCWFRSASVGKRERSSEIDSALGTSSLDMPEKSVAQATKLPTEASVASGNTASAPPNSPWPKISGRPLTCALGHQADEALLLHVARAAARADPRRSSAKRAPTRAAGAVEEAGDRERAVHAPHGAESCALVTVKAGAAARGVEVVEVGVAQLGEGAVSHRQQAPGHRAAARHGEVPGQVEALAPDARALEPAEDALEVARAPAAGAAVAVAAEGPPCGDQPGRGRPSGCAAPRCSAGPRASWRPGG